MKEPLLLIHGFTDTANTWRTLIPLLEPHHQVLAPTMAGHCGGPPAPVGVADPMCLVADHLERVLDEAGHDKAHLAGNSLGGWLALELAARGRALSVVTLSPAMGWEGDQPPAHTRRQFDMAHRFGPFMAKHGKSFVTRPRLRKLLFRDVVAHPERMSPATAYDLLVGSAGCSLFDDYIQHLEQGNYRGQWPNDLGVPTRIAWGTRDRTIPFRTCSSWFRTALPNAEWVELPDCGHLPQHDDPELIARTILEVTTACASETAAV